jgi:hypothetical protein
MTRPTVQQLREQVAGLERAVAELKTAVPPVSPAPEPRVNAPAAAAVESTPRHVPKENAEPGVPAAIISEKDITRLHKVYDETEDPAVGRVLDQVCNDPKCAHVDE